MGDWKILQEKLETQSEFWVWVRVSLCCWLGEYVKVPLRRNPEMMLPSDGNVYGLTCGIDERL